MVLRDQGGWWPQQRLARAADGRAHLHVVGAKRRARSLISFERGRTTLREWCCMDSPEHVPAAVPEVAVLVVVAVVMCGKSRYKAE